MDNNQPRAYRRSVRLQDYHYSQAGAYFITVCTQERRALFGEIVDGEMVLNDAGRAVEHTWLAIPQHFPQVELDAFVVMPNHLHGIVVISGSPVGAKDFSPLHRINHPPFRPVGTPAKSIGSIVRGFKIGVTKWFRERGDTRVVWQRNYYEHVIRGEESMSRIREYIQNNPARWEFDRENPAATSPEKKDAWL